MSVRTPRRRLAAEWEPQSGVMLTWPHPATDWADTLSSVEPVFARIGSEIARRERLLNICTSEPHATAVRGRLLAAAAPTEHLSFVVCPSNDTWARDHGPLTVLEAGKARLIDFRFNGWGGKFDAGLDDAITAAAAAAGVFGDTPVETSTLVCEGGAIETDGRGTLLATRHSMLTDTRNPALGQAELERMLGALLGLSRFRWLEHGRLSGDDTDGHIDTLARFCDPNTIAYVTAERGDADRPGLEAMRAELEGLRRPDGKSYRLVPLPPPGRHVGEGRRLPATYANFLILNGAVLLPVYGVPNDGLAIARLETCFPGRRVVPIDCRSIIRQNGSLHCLTMQFPEALRLGH